MNGMKGFIEVTDKQVGCKMLFPVSRISCVFESDDGRAFIETGVDRRGESTGLYVEETFYTVAQRVAAASGGECIPVCPNNELKKLKGG